MFKSPYEIVEAGVDKLSFTYNDGNDRSVMFYGGLGAKESRQYRKHYSADGSMEVKENRTTGAIEFITYIGGDGYSAPLIYKITSTPTTNNQEQLLYLHRDYQGSILAITDATGVVQEKRLFDAWGLLIKLVSSNGQLVIDNGQLQISNYTLLLDRGYTGHEHLTSVGLIHMNGRLYDPRLHRFLQPDNYVQDPTNTQSYNRYGYCWNNPLKYTDPSGELFVIDDLLIAVAIAAAVSTTTYLAVTYFSGGQITLKGFLTAAVTGAISGAVTFGIGSWMSGVGNIYLKATYSALLHGTFNGMMSGIQGGKFWTGFASGALSSIASSLWQGGIDVKTDGNLTTETTYRGISGLTGLDNGTGTIIFGTISGGVGAELTGGNFWQGAATGFMVSALNHEKHGTPKRGYTSRQYVTDKNGNITGEKLVYFKKGKYKDSTGEIKNDKALYQQAMSEPVKIGVLSIYAHGSIYNLNYYVNSNDIINMFGRDSSMWQNYKTSGGNLTIDLKSCFTGYYSQKLNISQALTAGNPGLTIYAAANLWKYDGTVQDNAGYNKYIDGFKTDWTPKR